MRPTHRELLGFLAGLPARLWKGGFVRNVATVATGAGAAIGISLLTAPILTRLYTPEEFGAFAAFLSIASILSVAVAGRYELAVVLADSPEEARRLVLACTCLTLIGGIVLYIAIFGVGQRVLAATEVQPSLLWLLPSFVMLLAVGQAANNWLNWSENYVLLGYGRTTRNASTAGAQVGLAFAGFGSLGLVAGRLAGEIAFGLISASRYLRENTFFREDLRWSNLRTLLKKHVRFPIYTLPSAFINKSNSELPEILLLSLFDPRAAGLYALTRRAVDRPLGFLSDSVREVFYRRFADSQWAGGDMAGLLTKATLGVAAIVVPPVIAVMFIAPDLVAWIFGEKWREAGDFIRVLAPAIAAHLVVRATSLSMYVLDKQDVVLWWTVIFLVLSTGGLLIGAHLGDALLAVGLLAGVKVVMYGSYFFLNLYYARQSEIWSSSIESEGPGPV